MQLLVDMEAHGSDTSTSTIVDSITQLRDEIRLKVHLAGLDVKEKWQELEGQVQSLEHRLTSDGGSAANATIALARDLKQSLVDFHKRLSH